MVIKYKPRLNHNIYNTKQTFRGLTPHHQVYTKINLTKLS